MNTLFPMGLQSSRIGRVSWRNLQQTMQSVAHISPSCCVRSCVIRSSAQLKDSHSDQMRISWRFLTRHTILHAPTRSSQFHAHLQPTL